MKILIDEITTLNIVSSLLVLLFLFLMAIILKAIFNNDVISLTGWK